MDTPNEIGELTMVYPPTCDSSQGSSSIEYEDQGESWNNLKAAYDLGRMNCTYRLAMQFGNGLEPDDSDM